MGLNIKKIFSTEPENDVFSNSGDEFYEIKTDELLSDGGSKMILMEPRAYSESQQIADHLKRRNTVVCKLKKSNFRSS